jgi:hypothetical protein
MLGEVGDDNYASHPGVCVAPQLPITDCSLHATVARDESNGPSEDLHLPPLHKRLDIEWALSQPRRDMEAPGVLSLRRRLGMICVFGVG